MDTVIHRKQKREKALCSTVMLFSFSAFLLLFFRDFAWQGLALAIAVPALIWLGCNAVSRFLCADRLLLILMHFLCALGIIVLYDTNPAYAYHQLLSYAAGMVAMGACAWGIHIIKNWKKLIFLLMSLSFVLVLPLLFGRKTYGAQNWIYIGPLSLQPSELVKICLIPVVAYMLNQRWYFALLVYAGVCLGILMLQADLGTALLYYGTMLSLYFAATGNFLITGIGLGGSVGAAILGYHMFAHVRKRVALWQNPWASYDMGYQIIHGLMAIASGGLCGIGLGLGSPKTIPVYFSDFIFAVICEQFGVIFGCIVLLVYVAIILRGASIAITVRHTFHGLVALGCTLMIGLQTFVIIGGVLKLIPLTGVTMPFVSYGGSSMVSCMGLMGLLQGIAGVNADDMREDAVLAEMGEAYTMEN